MVSDGIKYADIICRYYGSMMKAVRPSDWSAEYHNTLSEADTEAIEKMLEELSDEDRQLFWMKYVDRLTYVQIEGRLPMSSSTAQRRITAMLRILANKLNRP